MSNEDHLRALGHEVNMDKKHLVIYILFVFLPLNTKSCLNIFPHIYGFKKKEKKKRKSTNGLAFLKIIFHSLIDN